MIYFITWVELHRVLFSSVCFQKLMYCYGTGLRSAQYILSFRLEMQVEDARVAVIGRVLSVFSKVR